MFAIRCVVVVALRTAFGARLGVRVNGMGFRQFRSDNSSGYSNDGVTQNHHDGGQHLAEDGLWSNVSISTVVTVTIAQ